MHKIMNVNAKCEITMVICFKFVLTYIRKLVYYDNVCSDISYEFLVY